MGSGEGLLRRARHLAHVWAVGAASAVVFLPSAAAGNAASAEGRAAPSPLRVVARGLAGAVYVAAAPAEPNRLYIVQRNGLVRVLAGGRLQSRPFVDLRSRVRGGGERGLFSIAFSPRYAADRLLYVCYTDREGAINVVELREAGGSADLASARVLVRVPHEDSPYHNGGQLAFGPDGKLYAGFGDGGYRGPQPDPHGNSQNLDVLLGKIVRLDPSAPESRPEIVAYGLRNPWRFSFDPPTGDLIIGDVGWFDSEEIDVLPAGTSGLVNFGWSVYEGRRERKRGDPVQLNPSGSLAWPVHTYLTGIAQNCSITGGYVYRGRAVARLRGRYVFGDFCSGWIWSMRLAGGRGTDVRLEPVRVKMLASFGLDASGELYAVALTGTIHRFVR